MRIFMLLITAANLCSAMQPAHTLTVFTLEGHPLIFTITKPTRKNTVTGIKYREYNVYKHEKKIKGRNKNFYTGSVEIALGYDESLPECSARSVFITLMAKVSKLSANP